MPQVSAAVLRSKPSSTSASASIRRAAALFFSPLAALRSSEAVRSSRVIDTATPIDAAPLKSPHRVRVSLIWESLMSHSLGPLVLGLSLLVFLKVGGRWGGAQGGGDWMPPADQSLPARCERNQALWRPDEFSTAPAPGSFGP